MAYDDTEKCSKNEVVCNGGLAMKEIYLKELAHARSGDKGDTSNVCVYARNPEDYEFLSKVLTVEKVREHFGDIVKGEIIRYDVESLHGFNFVMKNALGGGATMSIRLDSLGKSMGSAFMRMKINIEEGQNENK